MTDLIGTHFQGPLVVHDAQACAGQRCCIHNPSVHALDSAPLYWRGFVMERICPHGVGHPDPDDAAWRRRTGQITIGTHGCDGCCAPPLLAALRAT